MISEFTMDPLDRQHYMALMHDALSRDFRLTPALTIKDDFEPLPRFFKPLSSMLSLQRLDLVNGQFQTVEEMAIEVERIAAIFRALVQGNGSDDAAERSSFKKL